MAPGKSACSAAGVKLSLLDLAQGEDAQDLIEYTLLLAFVALAGAAALVSMGNTSAGIWTTVNSRLSNASGS